MNSGLPHARAIARWKFKSVSVNSAASSIAFRLASSAADISGDPVFRASQCGFASKGDLEKRAGMLEVSNAVRLSQHMAHDWTEFAQNELRVWAT